MELELGYGVLGNAGLVGFAWTGFARNNTAIAHTLVIGPQPIYPSDDYYRYSAFPVLVYDILLLPVEYNHQSGEKRLKQPTGKAT